MFPVSPRFTRPRFAPGLVALAVGACAFVLVSSASAQGSTLTFKELNKRLDVRIRRQRTDVEGQGRAVRLGRRPDRVHEPAHREPAKRIGRLYMPLHGRRRRPAGEQASFACEGVVGLGGGTLTVQAFLPHAGATVHGTVTGGTGAYANARGTLVSRPTKTGADDTISLVA